MIQTRAEEDLARVAGMAERMGGMRSTVSTGHFVLGKGPSGTFGHVALSIEVTEAASGVEVAWNAGDQLDSAVRQWLLDWVSNYLKWYVSDHPQFGFRVKINNVQTDPVRRNELDRAAWIAIIHAIDKLELPPLKIYAPPDEDE